jgi:hypothetical protein
MEIFPPPPGLENLWDQVSAFHTNLQMCVHLENHTVAAAEERSMTSLFILLTNMTFPWYIPQLNGSEPFIISSLMSCIPQ